MELKYRLRIAPTSSQLITAVVLVSADLNKLSPWPTMIESDAASYTWILKCMFLNGVDHLRMRSELMSQCVKKILNPILVEWNPL